jgi:hypothetical protein
MAANLSVRRRAARGVTTIVGMARARREGGRSLLSDSSGAATERSGRSQATPGAVSVERSGTDGSLLGKRSPSLRRESGGAVSAAKPRGGRRYGNRPGCRWDGELRDWTRSGLARTGEGSPDPSPPKEKAKKSTNSLCFEELPGIHGSPSPTRNINSEQSRSPF